LARRARGCGGGSGSKDLCADFFSAFRLVSTFNATPGIRWPRPEDFETARWCQAVFAHATQTPRSPSAQAARRSRTIGKWRQCSERAATQLNFSVHASVGSISARKPKSPARFGPTPRREFVSERFLLPSSRPTGAEPSVRRSDTIFRRMNGQNQHARLGSIGTRSTSEGLRSRASRVGL
jgi:hypothetical protein